MNIDILMSCRLLYFPNSYDNWLLRYYFISEVMSEKLALGPIVNLHLINLNF